MDKIQFRRDTLANWASANPILAEGEIGYVLDDLNRYKMGDGIKTWDQLPFRGFDGTLVQELGDSETTVMSQKATTKAIHEILYDVSSHNDGAVFESLSTLLGSTNLSTLIPTSVRHGGMSIRFIQGSVQNPDSKYVQYRLMLPNFTNSQFAKATNWQGVDDEPTAGSDNLVKSGTAFGIAAKFGVNELSLEQGIWASSDGKPNSDNYRVRTKELLPKGHHNIKCKDGYIIVSIVECDQFGNYIGGTILNLSKYEYTGNNYVRYTFGNNSGISILPTEDVLDFLIYDSFISNQINYIKDDIKTKSGSIGWSNGWISLAELYPHYDDNTRLINNIPLPKKGGMILNDGYTVAAIAKLKADGTLEDYSSVGASSVYWESDYGIIAMIKKGDGTVSISPNEDFIQSLYDKSNDSELWLEQGGISSSDGIKTKDGTRVRCKKPLDSDYVRTKSGFLIVSFVNYDKEGNYLNGKIINANEYEKIHGDKFIDTYLVFKKIDDSKISPDEDIIETIKDKAFAYIDDISEGINNSITNDTTWSFGNYTSDGSIAINHELIHNDNLLALKAGTIISCKSAYAFSIRLFNFDGSFRYVGQPGYAGEPVYMQEYILKEDAKVGISIKKTGVLVIEDTIIRFLLDSGIELYYNYMDSDRRLNVKPSGDFITYYSSSVTKEIDPRQINLSWIYGHYDALMSEINDNKVMSKKLLGYVRDNNNQELTEYHIYEYTINPPILATSINYAADGGIGQRLQYPTILISTGIHPYETGSIYALYEFIKDMLTNRTNEFLKSLRNNVVLKIVPIASPYGLEHGTSAYNSNVNLNRNFGYHWDAQSYGGEEAGSAPYSESETQVYKSWLDSNKNAILHVDFHTTRGNISTYITSADIALYKIFSVLVNEFITHFDRFNYNVISQQDWAYITNTYNANTTNEAYKIVGIKHSCTIEFSSYDQSVSDKSLEYTDNVIRCGIEVIGNFLRKFLDSIEW